MNVVREAALFIAQSHTSLRVGELSREALTILRLEWRGGYVECDWLMRPIDPWDRNLPQQKALEQQTLQAFRDALALRELVYASFTTAMDAQLRMFRADRDRRLELFMAGQTTRLNQYSNRVPSLAMRAKLSGFRFVLSNGILEGPLKDEVG